MRDLAPVELQLGGVGAQPRVGLAAQELPDGGVQGLAANVPQGDVDARDARHDNAAVAHPPERKAMQPIPNLLVVHGVKANDALCEVDRHSESGALRVAVGDAHLAQSRNALVGVDAHEDGMPRHVADGDLRGNRGLLE